LYKIHGCVSKKNFVITKDQYEDTYGQANSSFVKSLSSFFQGFHFLFLGCSLNIKISEGTKDRPIELWENLQQKGSGMYHYAILECACGKDKIRREELENIGIRPILYETGKYEAVQTILEKLRSENKNTLFAIPYDRKHKYIEREDSVIDKIKHELEYNKFSACAITGIGGVGKTKILCEYANQLEKTTTQVFWFNAISADNIKEEIFRFVFEELPLEKDRSYDIALLRFKTWMTEHDNWLFLLDNVEDYDDIKVFFDFDQTLAGNRHVLISSRLNAAYPHPDYVRIIPIKVFTQKESLNFLYIRTKQELDNHAKEIAIMLDGLPLALEYASAFISAERNETYETYVKLLKECPISKLDKMRLSHVESVGATWNISMQRITNEGGSAVI